MLQFTFKDIIVSSFTLKDLIVSSFALRDRGAAAFSGALSASPASPAQRFVVDMRDILVSSLNGPAGPSDRSRVQPYPGAAELARRLQSDGSGGADLILVGPTRSPGWQRVDLGGNGIIAILIGLLLPATLSLGRENSIEGLTLRTALRPQGRLALLGEDGRLQDLGGRHGSHKTSAVA